MLAETMLANIAVSSWWRTEGLQNSISICNCMAAESVSGLIEAANQRRLVTDRCQSRPAARAKPNHASSRPTLRPEDDATKARVKITHFSCFCCGGTRRRLCSVRMELPCAVLRRPEALDCRVRNTSRGLEWTYP